MSRTITVVVVGGSVAAVTAAQELRAQGFDGRIVVLAAEAHPPYVRPPLSKGVLDGSVGADTLALPTPQAEVRLGARATALDVTAKTVTLDNGESVAFDKLVIATGARARRLDPAENAAEDVLRTVDDATRLRERLSTVERIVVVGGGFIGMEVASSARARGIAVTVIDTVAPLRAQLGPYLSQRLIGRATDNGVEIVVDPGGATIQRDRDAIRGVVTSTGRRYEADLVLTCVGCRPNAEWLHGSGLYHARGVVVDSRCRVTDDIVACGDVAAFHRDGAPTPSRLPFWTNAVEQAKAAARSLLYGDAAEAYAPASYFWTDQFGLRLRLRGRLPAVGDPVIVDGDPEDNSALLQWRDESGRPVAAAAMNRRVPNRVLTGLATGNNHELHLRKEASHVGNTSRASD